MVKLRTLSFQSFKVIKHHLSKYIFFSVTPRELFTWSSCTCTYCFVRLQVLEEEHWVSFLSSITCDFTWGSLKLVQIITDQVYIITSTKRKTMKGSPRPLCKFASRTSKSSNSPISFLLRPGFFFSTAILPFKRFRFRLKTKC